MPNEDQIDAVTDDSIGRPIIHETKNRFLNDLYETELDLSNKFSKPEIEDIHEAVKEQLNALANAIGEKDERLKIREVIPVGSASEGTQIIRPCEFDCILIIGVLSQPGVVEVKVENANVTSREYVLVKVKDDNVRSMLCDVCCSAYDFVRCSYGIGQSLGRRYGLNRRAWYRQGLRGLSCNRRGLSDLFYNAVYEDTKLCSQSAIQMETGDLRIKSSKPEETSPAFNIKLLWNRAIIENQPTMEISVDLVPALKLSLEMYESLLVDTAGFEADQFEHVRDVGSVLLIPRNHWSFHVNFTDAELLRTRGLSEHRRKCYKILKFIVNGEPFPLDGKRKKLLKYFQDTHTMFHSYTLKCVVREHHYLQQCNENDDLSICISKMLTRIRCILAEGLMHPFYRNRYIQAPRWYRNPIDGIFHINQCKERPGSMQSILNKMDTTPIEEYSYDTFRRSMSHYQLWKYKAKAALQIILMALVMYGCVLCSQYLL